MVIGGVTTTGLATVTVGATDIGRQVVTGRATTTGRATMTGDTMVVDTGTAGGKLTIGRKTVRQPNNPRRSGTKLTTGAAGTNVVTTCALDLAGAAHRNMQQTTISNATDLAVRNISLVLIVWQVTELETPTKSVPRLRNDQTLC